MRTVEAELGEVIDLGVTGEHLVTKVIFNPSSYKLLYDDYMEDINYDDGFFSLFIEQNGIIYPQTIFKTGDNKLIWYVESKNTAVAGSGRAQLIYILNHTIELSEIFELHVTANIFNNDSDIPSEFNDDIGFLEELVDIRKTYDNIVFSKAGDAVRAQISDIHNMFWTGTKDEYEAITTPDDNVFYFVMEEEE